MVLPPTPLQMRTLLTWCAPVLFAAGLAHLGFQIVKHWEIVTLDFRFFWLAGKFWTFGVSPYGPGFAEEAALLFGIEKGAIWYYTPNWFLITAVFSLFDPLISSRAWSIANVGLLLGASALNVAAFRAMPGRSALIRFNTPFTELLRSLSPLHLFFLHAGFMGLAQAAGNSLHLGQSSMLIYFGASLVIFAAVKKRELTGAAGLALLMLKPQIGLMVVVALALSPYGRRVIAAAALASFLLAAPAFIITRAPEMIASLISGATQYTDQSYNLAAAMTGLRHLVWAAGGAEMGAPFYLLLAITAICGLGLAGRSRAQPPRTIDMIMVAIAATLFLAPLHVYDFTLAGALLLYCAALRPPAGAVSIAAFLLLWRAGNLPHPPAFSAPGLTYYPGSFYATAAIGVIFCSLMVFFAPGRRQRSARKMAPV